jgi:hypothetical protein
MDRCREVRTSFSCSDNRIAARSRLVEIRENICWWNQLLNRRAYFIDLNQPFTAAARTVNLL